MSRDAADTSVRATLATLTPAQLQWVGRPNPQLTHAKQ